MLEINHLHKKFKKKTVLDDLNLLIEDNEHDYGYICQNTKDDPEDISRDIFGNASIPDTINPQLIV